MSGLKSFLTISSFVFLIAAGALVAISAGLQPGSGDGAARGGRSEDGSRLALITPGSGQRDQDLKLLLALKVFGSGNAARKTPARNNDPAPPPDRDADSRDRDAPGS